MTVHIRRFAFWLLPSGFGLLTSRFILPPSAFILSAFRLVSGFGIP
jgi:hypothetical protein